MEKFDEIKYKGFNTKFYITNKVKEYLARENVNLNNLKERSNEDYSFFYEALLFEIIDENGDGIPDEKFGKDFKVVYYGILKEKDEYNDDLEHDILESVEGVENFEEEEIDKSSKIINIDKEINLEIKYKILKE